MPLLAPLPPRLTDAVLAFLGVPAPRHDPAWLDALMRQYGQRVPWESASRIVRHRTLPPHARHLTPDVFWEHAMTHGTGGTCFESNGALSAVLAAVGFSGYLTMNDMDQTLACLTAVVVTLSGTRVLVDAGYPIHAALPLTDQREDVHTPWFTYTTTPAQGGRYVIENRPHPRPYLFHLIDTPVAPDRYAAATRADYGPAGLFLDRVVIRKIVDGRVTRFASAEVPWHIQAFEHGEHHSEAIGDDVATAGARLAAHFGMPAAVVLAALRACAGGGTS
jgi:hypothetical protein